jgi:hypothetical protein
VASVLGVSRNHAHTLLSRARDQLEACLGVLLVGRVGRDECDELSAMLAGWDGRLTVLLRKRVHRHIEHCATCAARRAFELRPAMLLDLSPGAAMAAGAAESFRLAFGAPPGLRAHTMALATGHGPAAAAHSTAVLGRAGAFGRQGFPKPAHAGLAGQHGVAGGVRALRSSPRGQVAMAAAVVVAVAVATVAIALTGRAEHFTPSANPKPRGSAPPAPPSAGATTRPATIRSATVKPPTGKPTARTKPVPPQAPTTASTTPTPTPTRANSGPPPPPRPTPGTLSVLPGGGTMVVVPGLTGSPVSLHASGGTVNWSGSVANDPDHVVSVSPADAGTLTPADPAITLTVRVSRFVRCGLGTTTPCPAVTISPRGATFAVWTGWTLPFPRGSRRPSAAPGGPAPGGRTSAGTPPAVPTRRITIR